MESFWTELLGLNTTVGCVYRSRDDPAACPCVCGGLSGSVSHQGPGMCRQLGTLSEETPTGQGPRGPFPCSCLEAPDTCCDPVNQHAAVCPTWGVSELQGPLSHRSWVCLCKAACQESTSPTGDVAAGCRFPLKSPGQDSGEALNIRCLSPPGGG